MHHTQAGLILGTAAYMAPEQARGKPSDRRADVWAFGAVLYEMLAGRPLFSGEMVTDILAAVISQEPKLDALPSDIRPIVAKCLRKDPRKRWQSMGDVRLALEERGTAASEGAPVSARPRSRLAWAGWAVAGVLAVSLGLALLWLRETDRPLLRLNVDLGPGALADSSSTALISAGPVIAPDGSRLVFPVLGREGRGQLATRLLGQPEPTPLSGTEGGGQPFFSPDSQWIGFFADGKLRKISIQGGAAVTLCDAPNPRGGTWGEDGTIVAALSNVTGLSRVPEAGGAPQALTQLAAGEATHRWPQFLPGGEHVLFTSSTNIDIYEDATIDVVSLNGGERKTVQRGGYFGRLLPTGQSTGHLVYVHLGVLLAQTFNISDLAASGMPLPIIQDVGSNPTTGAGLFDASRTGAFVYSRGNTGNAWPAVWLDASGKAPPLLPPAIYYHPRVSPDGQRVALSLSTAQGLNIFVHDTRRDATTRVSFTSPQTPDPAKVAQAWNNSNPVWTPGGRHLVFRARTATSEALAWIRADGAGEPLRLIESKNAVTPSSFSQDGRRLAYVEETPGAGSDIWILPLDPSDADRPKPGKPAPFLRTPFNETSPAFSPDGRWMAYGSNETGVAEVYVRPAAGAAVGKWQVSTSGGRSPRWARNGQELFYESLDSRIMGRPLHRGRRSVPGRQTQAMVGGATVLAGRRKLGPGAGRKAAGRVRRAHAAERRSDVRARRVPGELLRRAPQARGALTDSPRVGARPNGDSVRFERCIARTLSTVEPRAGEPAYSDRRCRSARACDRQARWRQSRDRWRRSSARSRGDDARRVRIPN
jgi:serine/threonine-protein kinase